MKSSEKMFAHDVNQVIDNGKKYFDYSYSKMKIKFLTNVLSLCDVLFYFREDLQTRFLLTIKHGRGSGRTDRTND